MGHVYFRAQIIARKELATASDEKPDKASTPARPSATGIIGSRTALPFIPEHDIPRGLLHMGQTAFGFAFMLAVMYVYVDVFLNR